MFAPTANFTCERCGQDANGIAGCHNRGTGTCPFVEIWRKRKSGGILKAFLFLVLSYWFFHAWINVWWFVSILAATIGIWAVTFDILLYNTSTHTKIRHTTFAGIVLSHIWTTKGEPLPIQIQPIQLIYPASIIALYTLLRKPFSALTPQEAGAVFRSALVNMLANEYIQVYLFKSYIFKRWQATPAIIEDYAIVAAENTRLPAGSGVLEGKILHALLSRWIPEEREEWMGELPVYDLVLKVYPGILADAPGWLVKLVADEAIAHNFCHIIKSRAKGWNRMEYGLHARISAANAYCAGALAET